MDKEDIILKKAELEDAEFVLELRNQPYVREVSWNTDIIMLEDHLKFWADNYQDYWIIRTERHHQPIGFIRIKEKEVSIAVDKEFWNKSVGQTVLKKLMVSHPELKAEVKIDNVHSLCFFVKCGFVPKGIILKKGGI